MGAGTHPRAVFLSPFDENLLINELTLGAIDPISKEPDYKKCAAVVYKKGEPVPLSQPKG